MKRALASPLGLTMVATAAFSLPAAAQPSIDQALHEGVTTAYQSVATFVGDMEGSISSAARSVYDEVVRDIAGLGERIEAAAGLTVDAAAMEYREIQHGLEGIGHDADTLLHDVGHTIDDVEHQAWTGLEAGVTGVSNAIDHALDAIVGVGTVERVEQALHDDVVAAFAAVSSFVDRAEGTVAGAAGAVWDEVVTDLGALEARIEDAVGMTGEVAVREYREIQHGLEGVGHDVDDLLHQAGHMLSDVEHEAWATIEGGVNTAANTIDHVIDALVGDGTAERVEQALHDDVVAAYAAVTGLIGGVETAVTDTGRAVFDEVSKDAQAIGERIDAAAGLVGDAAVREYREIQHALEGVGHDADSLLHEVGHTIEDVEHQAWTLLQGGVDGIANAINHVLGELHLG